MDTYDGKYGWVIVTGSFVIYFITLGTSQSIGVIYSDLLKYFNRGKGETAWLPSLFSGMMFLMGPLAGFLTERFGCRCITIVGAITMAVGMFTSAFVPTLPLLYVTFGVVSGTGHMRWQ